MRFTIVTSAALLLATVATAQFAVYARSANPDSISARDAYERDASQLYAREPVYTHHEIQQKQDHIKGQTMTYEDDRKHLDTMHANGASHTELAHHHTHLAHLAQGISDARHDVNNNHPNGPNESHRIEANGWAKQAGHHTSFAAQHLKAAAGHGH